LTLLCLRLAVLLSRRREDPDTLPVTLTADGKNIDITADKAWLESHPLSQYSLKAEKQEWVKAGFDFELIET
jgi:exopolyphosphatase/guanosine-5'-triphosphate,3'-diphosphate pyrophosphatase